MPYHATAYLAGHLRSSGFHDVTMRDVNIEYVNHCLKPDTIRWVYEEIDSKIAAFNQTRELTYVEQEAYYRFAAKPRLSTQQILDAASTLRNKDCFLDYPNYLKSTSTLVMYMGIIGDLCYPAEHSGFAQVYGDRISLASLDDLFNESLSDRICFTFNKYFHDHIANDPDYEASNLLGISIVYDHQLFHALHFARLIKKQWPLKKIVLGGTAITQMYKYMLDKNGMKRLFEYCDAVVIGEGETALCEIAAANGEISDGHFVNTITYSKTDDKLHFPEIHYENVSLLGSPIYDHPWHLYLSPARGVNYSPTRGCYWNRCTFCDYGLNTDKPTSLWRERTIEQVVADLQNAVNSYGIQYVYFAVDVMAPGYVERLSDAIIESGLNIKWASELRMERIFTLERAQKMRKAGCVCVSFGMESGSQRILNLIDKGTRLEYMVATMKNFAAAGIAFELMAFTGFPAETSNEKTLTFEFIRDNREYWSVGGVGTFVLSGTSIVAKNPDKFGITILETKDVDIRRSVAYRIDGESEKEMARNEEANGAFGDHAGVFPVHLLRPWAGGTDTLHTIIYFDQHGRNFFKNAIFLQVTEIKDLTNEQICNLSVSVNGNIAESAFDLGEIVKNRRLYPDYIQERTKVPAEPTYGSYTEWSKSVAPAVAQEFNSFWILLEDRCGKLNKLIYQILLPATRETVPISKILDRCPEVIRHRVLTYLKDLEVNGFVSFKDGDHVIRKKAQSDNDAT
jgi:radical SAM superfamily enzyme YgiQ (UPF0313 family)